MAWDSVTARKERISDREMFENRPNKRDRFEHVYNYFQQICSPKPASSAHMQSNRRVLNSRIKIQEKIFQFFGPPIERQTFSFVFVQNNYCLPWDSSFWLRLGTLYDVFGFVSVIIFKIWTTRLDEKLSTVFSFVFVGVRIINFELETCLLLQPRSFDWIHVREKITFVSRMSVRSIAW